VLLSAAVLAVADGPSDNKPDNVRPVPPPGSNLPESDRADLQTATDNLGKEIDSLKKTLAGKPDLLALLPDVQIYHNAVRYALKYNEFYDKNIKNDVKLAHDLLKQGHERARELRDGKPTWTMATGLVARGYVSKIDGSVQPYGLVIPPSYKPDTAHKFRLDLWCHGRGETLTEMAFVNQRQKSAGEFVPPNTFVLHLYGRYCCANKFAGEIDALEAMADVKKHYPIDDNRVVVRGFSMGGAACWQFAVHYPSQWCAAAPGAGFSETARFLDVFQKETVQPTWYEKKLYHMYDCTDYAANLFNLPTVAYSGEKDRQKQAADVMAEAMEKEGLTLTHIIGPGTEHRYHPEAKKEVNRRIDTIAERGRDQVPGRVRFTTYTLRYNHSFWVRVDGLESHWERADVDAHLGPNRIHAQTKNITALTLAFGPGSYPRRELTTTDVTIDEQLLKGPPMLSDRSWVAHLRKTDGKWQIVDKADGGTLVKRHGLQGPIDDAFMDSFLFVRPTGTPLNDRAGTWASAEMKRAIEHWRKQFRGEARIKDDKDVTDADIAAHNLILWGDPSSNKLLAKVLDRLPIKWDAKSVQLGKESFDAADHAPVMIYPNPLNPKQYVVLNSGFTFRDYDYLNNARQISKLPDWAVIDLRTPPGPRWPGKVATAGFFDEKWQLKGEKK
jgi:dienelactone hydrolase